jgi:L-seryl-tRNA(Ser) seleniumtransferase
VPSDSTPARAADIPSLDRLLNEVDFAPALMRYSRTQVTTALREALTALRQQAALGELFTMR